MKRHTPIVLITIALLMLAGCNQSATNNDNVSIESQAWALIEQGATIIDVRSQQEYDQGHLHNSVLMPYDQVADKIASLSLNKDQPIVLYCHSGNRAGKSEATLREMGFSNIFNGGGYQPLMKSKQP